MNCLQASPSLFKNIVISPKYADAKKKKYANANYIPKEIN